MRESLAKTAAVLVMLGLLLPGALIMHDMPAASASPSLGRVSVSGTNILVDGSVPSEKFFGVDDTTALQFAIMTYINGESGVRGWSSVFNTPDTPNYVRSPVVPNDTPENFWHQYFALLQYYDCNLVRIGCGDTWGTGLQYDAWLNHHDAYISLLRTMCEQAEAHGVWVTLVLAGSQEYPTFQFGGSGSVFDPSSSAFSRYASYCRDVMAELENENAICWYDLFNEPDHNYVARDYWQGDKMRFHNWAKAAVAATDGASSHPRTMGVAALGTLFGWNKADFDLAVGKTGVEILHVHYYGSNYDANNFNLPEGWARQNGKPLFWGELAYNDVYPIVRYDFAEQAIWNAGGQAIASMVLTGTPGYPYGGGSLVDDHQLPADSTPPVVSITSPASGLVTGESSVTVKWSGSDASRIEGYRYRLDGGSWSSATTVTSALFSALLDGEHVVVVEATDVLGNSRSTSLSFVVDTSVPAIDITSPRDGTRTNSTSAEVEWSSEDPASLMSIELQLDDGTWTSYDVLSGHIALTGLSEGEHTVRVRGTYASGGSYVDRIVIHVDTVPPAKGMVTDAEGRPVPGAVVVLSIGGQAVTGDDGIFVLDVEPGTYDATVSKDGYQSVMVSVRLGPDEMALVGLAPEEKGPSSTMMLVVGLGMLAITLIAIGMILPGRKG